MVADSLLAAAGTGILYLLARMAIADIQHGLAVNWFVLGTAITLTLSMVVLGSMLAKAELTDWR